MLREPVAIQITRGTLEAVAASHARWKTLEEVWQAFREWKARRGVEVLHSFEEKPPFFHELLDLFEFGSESCPSLGEEGFLALAGRRFAGILLRERLPDLLAEGMAPSGGLPVAIGNLFVKFLAQYAGRFYRIVASPATEAVVFRIAYADPQATLRHLRAYDKDPVESFRKSFRVITGSAEGCLQYLLDPWSGDHLTSNPREGVFTVRLPKGTKFNYRKLTGTLTQYAHQLQERHSEELLARDLEHTFILQSPFMRATWDRIRLAAASDETLLLRGEPGTGKTYLAERIHEMSSRKGRPFVEVGLTADLGGENLVQSHLFGHMKGAFTSAHEDKKGLFAHSDSGTIFLDEIGDAGPDLQAKLLRVIEKRTFKPLGGTKDVVVDVRILVATNRDLEALVRAGKFREDLYHRINVIQIEMPPLRERRGEIPVLCDYFLRRLSLETRKPLKSAGPEVLDLFSRYPWPGNIREFIHVLKHALVFSQGERILLKDLPERLLRDASRSAPPPAGDVIDEARLAELLARSGDLPRVPNDTTGCPWHIDHAKKTYLRALLRHFKGNVRKITTLWDCDSEHTMRAVIRRLGLWEELERARDGR